MIYVVKPDDDGMRLDRVVRMQNPALTFPMIQKLVRKKVIKVDKKRCTHNQRVSQGQSIFLPNIREDSNKKPVYKMSAKDEQFIQDMVIYKDDDIIAINKPYGLCVQGGTKTTYHIDMLLDGLRFGYEERPKLVHRIDRDTSGVLLIARTRKYASKMLSNFQGREVKKSYVAIVHAIAPNDGTINTPLEKLTIGGVEKVVKQTNIHSKMKINNAVTNFERLAYKGDDYDSSTLLLLNPITGRKHQIRAHLSMIGHPILGDFKYGSKHSDDSQKMCLHAYSITMEKDGEMLEINAPLPQHISDIYGDFTVLL